MNPVLWYRGEMGGFWPPYFRCVESVDACSWLEGHQTTVWQ